MKAYKKIYRLNLLDKLYFKIKLYKIILIRAIWDELYESIMRRKGVLRISIEEGYIKYQNSYFINYITLFLERKFEINRIEKSPLVTINKK